MGADRAFGNIHLLGNFPIAGTRGEQVKGLGFSLSKRLKRDLIGSLFTERFDHPSSHGSGKRGLALADLFDGAQEFCGRGARLDQVSIRAVLQCFEYPKVVMVGAQNYNARSFEGFSKVQ